MDSLINHLISYSFFDNVLPQLKFRQESQKQVPCSNLVAHI